MTPTESDFFHFAACWLTTFIGLGILWRFGMREMAFFRLVRETIGGQATVRWLLGLGASFVVSWLVLAAFAPVF